MNERNTDYSMGAAVMSIDTVLGQLSGMKDYSTYHAKSPHAEEGWSDDVRALESAISIISALQDEGITDAQEVHDLIYDYHALARQSKKMHQKYETATPPVRKDGVWHCPECNHRVHPRHSFCHWCGKKMGKMVEK